VSTPCSLQAPPPERKTERRKGVITKPKNGKTDAAAEDNKEERNPHLPTSLPMPSRVEDIHNDSMRAMWERPCQSRSRS